MGRSSATAASTIYEGLGNALDILKEAGRSAINEIKNLREEEKSEE